MILNWLDDTSRSIVQDYRPDTKDAQELVRHLQQSISEPMSDVELKQPEKEEAKESEKKDTKKEIVGFKIVNDNWTACNGFTYHYQPPCTYYHTGPLALYESGFHFCTELLSCLEYITHLKEFGKPTRFLQVKALGETVSSTHDAPVLVTNRLHLVKELDAQEIATIVHTCKASDYQRYHFLMHCLNWGKDDAATAIWNASPFKRQVTFLEMSLFHGTCILKFFNERLDQKEWLQHVNLKREDTWMWHKCYCLTN